MSRIRHILFILLAIGVSLIIGLTVLEIIFGDWLWRDQWSQTRDLNIIRNKQISYSVQNVYGHRKPLVHYTRDKFGLRGPCTKPEAVTILTLGGSTTDQRLINDGETWQDILQTELIKRGFKNTCIANAGVDGHSTFGHLSSFQKWLPLIDRLNPTYYILYIGINDAGFRLAPATLYDTYNANDPSVPKRTVLDNSALYGLMKNIRITFLNRLINPIPAYAGHIKNPPDDFEYKEQSRSPDLNSLIRDNTEAFKVRLSKIIDEIDKRQGTVVCINQPNLFTKTINGKEYGVTNAFEHQGRVFNGIDFQESILSLNSTMRHVCTRRGGYYIDMASKHYSKEDFYDYVHTTPRGAERLGMYMTEELSKFMILNKQ